ncbi:hypothetical protein [Lentzea waywayandensis]|nr:hypothetical protein [Lentzea waywayandensis]
MWTHRDDIGSRKVAERAGFVRDEDREIKGGLWPTVAHHLVP